MAIDLVTFRHLLRLRSNLPRKGRALVLGRQDFISHNPSPRMERQMTIYADLLRKTDARQDLADLIDDDGFCDSLFEYLGFEETDFMDMSDYEGANVLHDLNKPVGEDLHDRYDFILDGGTIEHVFNVPQAFENVHKMLRQDGTFLAFNPANNWLGHGFYQFSPELVWRFWRDAMGYRVNLCAINAMRDWYGHHTVEPSPPEARNMERDGSLRKLGSEGIFVLIYEVQKVGAGEKKSDVQQSDYQATWTAGTASGA